MPPLVRKVGPFVALFVMVASFYGATYSYRSITDTDLNSRQTRSLVLHGDIDLTRYNLSRLVFARPHNGNRYSIYGVGISLVGAPVYLITSHLDVSDRVTQGVAAIPFVAGAVVAMYWLLLRLFDKKRAIAGTIIFAFGTTMWPLASMAFYTHGPVALFQTLGIAALFSDRKRAPFWAGLAFATAMFIRPTLFIFVLTGGLLMLRRGFPVAIRYGLGAVLPVAGMLVQNRWIWGSWLKSGYSFAGVGFHGNIPRDTFALLFGWWRGIFVYSPILILAVVGFVIAFRKRRGAIESRLVALGVASIATLLFYARWTTWWNGLSQFGYRYLLDTLPALILLTAYAAPFAKRFRSVLIPAGIVSLMTMSAGSMPSKGAFDVVNFPKYFGQTPVGQAWTVALDEPLGPIIRLAGIGLIAGLLWRVTPARDEPA